MSKTKEKFYQQQGDVLIGTAEIPADAVVVNTRTLQEGELTGHSHTLFDGEYQVLKDKKENMYLRVLKEATLNHTTDVVNYNRADHDPQVIPPGDYSVEIIEEYDPFEKLTRKVID